MAKLVLVGGSVFGDLTRDAMRLVGALLGAVMAVVILAVVAVALIIAAPFVGLGGGGSQPPVLPAEHLAVMVDVSNETGVPWALLAAIASVESGFGQNMTTSWAGAVGYGQFMPPSWAAFGEGGDPYDYRDVIPAMARYLVAADVRRDIPGAVYAYNHDWDYVALVLSRATYYAASVGDVAAALGASVPVDIAGAMP